MKVLPLHLRSLLNHTLCSLVTVSLLLVAQPADADSTWSTATLAPGTRFATPVIVQESGVPGPVVMIVGGMHGNEPAGAAAAEQIADWPIARGTLIVVPRANVPALNANKRTTPAAPVSENNLNRNFVWTDGKVATQGEMAAELWRLVEQHHPDWVIDLHEGFDVHNKNDDSVGSSIIHDRSPEAKRLAEMMQAAVNAEVLDEANAFDLLGPPVAGSLARAAGDHTPARAMIVETTTKDRRLSLRVRQHRLMVACALGDLQMLPAGIDGNTIAPEARAAGRTRVAIYDDGGASVNGVNNLLKVCADREEILARRVCALDIRAGALQQFDLVCFGGGGGHNLSNSLEEPGRDAVRNFVSGGGDYLGVCAGSYLACSGFSWGLGILDAKTRSNEWQRGKATLNVEFEPVGRQFFATPGDELKLYYANGPIFAPNNKDDISDYEVLAWFREEVSMNGTPEGLMINTPAIVRGTFGSGDVYCFSPHPESTKGASYLLQRVIADQRKQRASSH